MLEKYNGNNVVIDLPSILTITGSVTITHASGTDTLDENPTIQIGNIESYDPITPNPVEAEEIETTPSLGGQSGVRPGGDNPPVDPGNNEEDNNQYAEGNNVSIGLKLNNTSNEDIYLSGYFEVGVEISGDWAPMCIRIFPQNTGTISYKLKAGSQVTIEHENLQFWVRGNENSTTETASKYLGGNTFNTFSNGVDGYHRAYSWSINRQGNTAEDSSYVIASLEITPFVSDGYVIVNISGTNSNEADDFAYKETAIELQ